MLEMPPLKDMSRVSFDGGDEFYLQGVEVNIVPGMRRPNKLIRKLRRLYPSPLDGLEEGPGTISIVVDVRNLNQWHHHEYAQRDFWEKDGKPYLRRARIELQQEQMNIVFDVTLLPVQVSPNREMLMPQHGRLEFEVRESRIEEYTRD